MEQMICTVERIMVNGKDWIDCLSTLILGMVTLFVAYRQYCISKQQKEIALYDARYNKIYLVLLNTISEIQMLTINAETFDSEKYDEVTSQCARDLDYARFLIKKEDFNNLLLLYNNSIKMMAERFEKTCNQTSKESINLTINAEKELDETKKKLLDIIIPYLQIETTSWYKRLLYKIRRKNNGK